MSDIQIWIPDRDGEGEWESIDEDQLDLSDHDAEVVNCFAELIIQTLSDIGYVTEETVLQLSDQVLERRAHGQS